jgi:hypothetical protein
MTQIKQMFTNNKLFILRSFVSLAPFARCSDDAMPSKEHRHCKGGSLKQSGKIHELLHFVRKDVTSVRLKAESSVINSTGQRSVNNGDHPTSLLGAEPNHITIILLTNHKPQK